MAAAAIVSKPPVASTAINRGENVQPLHQLFQTFAIACNHKGLSAWANTNVQSVFRYVDSYINRVHLLPSLRNRARVAAPATVRVRWNDGRRTALRNGLQSPWMTRSPIRHRVGQ